MIQLNAHTPLYIGLDPIDFRCGIDKLAIISQTVSGLDPKQGYVFAFRNRSYTSVKLLAFDGSGFWLMQKRLSVGRLQWWPRHSGEANLSAEELFIVLRGADPRGLLQPAWRRVKTLLDNGEAQTRHSTESRRA